MYCAYTLSELFFCLFVFFFFNDTATTEIYTLSLHDALPIRHAGGRRRPCAAAARGAHPMSDRKSTRLNSSHMSISYAVFCLKKKKNKLEPDYLQIKKRYDPHDITNALKCLSRWLCVLRFL